MVVGIAPISASQKLKGIGTMKEEIAVLKDRIVDLKEKLREIRGYL
jgi:hypothetical protein